MGNLSTDIENLKKKYREIFVKIGEDFGRKIENMDEMQFLNYLSEDVSKEIRERQNFISNCRNNFECLGCAACCKLACSEFSYEQLQKKAKEGDNFATQFVSVFVPYSDEKEAQMVYPEYFELLREQVQGQEVYFYHCPKVTDDNRCPDYENRPQICRDFPDNPIGLLPKICGFKKWNEQVESEALALRATLEIVDFYKEKLID